MMNRLEPPTWYCPIDNEPTGLGTPVVVVPKIIDSAPDSASDKPQVANMVSTVLPYRWRMTRRSTRKPKQPTTMGATISMAKIDDTHKAKDQGQPGRDQGQCRHRIGKIKHADKNNVDAHWSAFAYGMSALGRPRGARGRVAGSKRGL